MIWTTCTYTFTIELVTSAQTWSIDQELLYICRAVNACDGAYFTLTAPDRPSPARVYYIGDPAMTINIEFVLTDAGDCTIYDIQYTYQIYDPFGEPYSGTEIRFISSSANTATFTVFTDNTSITTGYYTLDVTAKVGLTNKLYTEFITISEPLCGSLTAPSL